MAAILPGFSTVAELGGVAPPVRLSRGPATRRLVCVPSPMALGALTAPVLFVRPAESFASGAATDDWRATWDAEHTLREVPGNDFTLLEERLAAPPGGGSAAGT
ncbi:hypothetical protein [Streptomyces niveus]|uniref:hypothetical protein n=1 Tax=Streptomyces niveus TaxID=193462 RepID=UPI0003C57E7B|nr:hypothetical protein [Streptomyces niveus]EST32824.1 hypothetical protein M877_03325 [Streptomyces niveus NCIMB 11891]